MRRRTIPCALVLALLGAGCAAVTDAAHATGYWSRQAARDAHERHHNRQLAVAAWEQARAANSGASEDYADGFKDGFADHLYRATIAAPPLPPKHYRELRYRTPAGFRAGEDWLAGFAHGIETARASGLRELVTGPSSLRADPAPPVSEVVAAPVAVPAPAPIPPAEPLPLRRRIDPPAVDAMRLPEPEQVAPPAIQTVRDTAPPVRVPEPIVAAPVVAESPRIVAEVAQEPPAPSRPRLVNAPDIEASNEPRPQGSRLESKPAPPVVAEPPVVPVRYDAPVPRVGPYLVPVASSQALLRAAVWVADPTPPGTWAPACDWKPATPAPLPVQSAVLWTPATPGPAIKPNVRPVEERSLPPAAAPVHWERQR